MRINLGNFGNNVAQPERGPRADPMSFGAGVGVTMQQVGRATAGIAENIQVNQINQAREEQRFFEQQQREAEALARAKAGNALLDMEIQTKTARQQIEQGIADGSVNYEQAPQMFDDVVSKFDMPQIDNMDDIARENLSKGVKRLQFGERSMIESAVQKARKNDYKAQTDAALDKLGKLSGMPGTAVGQVTAKVSALDELGGAAYGAEWGKRKQTFIDNAWFTQASQVSNQLSDNIDGLTRLKTELTTEKGFYADKLDPEKRTSLIRSIDGRLDQLLNRQQHSADKLEAKALRTLDEIDKQVSTAIPATPQQWLAWSQSVKGTIYENEFKARVNDEREVQELLRMPIEQQTQYLQQKQQAMASNGADLRTQANVKRLENAVTQNVKLLKEEPLIYAQNRTGEAIAPMDLTNPDDIANKLKERLVTVNALRKRHGSEVSLNAFLPQETDAMKKILPSVDNTNKLNILSALAEGTSGDARAYASTLKAVASDKTPLMLAGMAAFRNLKSTEGRSVAETILKGDKIIADKSVIMPTENAFKAAFEEKLGNAIPDGSIQREQAYIAFKTLYAGMADEKGVRHVNEDKNMADDKLADLAIGLATGGVSEYNDRKVIRPYGMKAEDFESAIESQLEIVAQNTGFDLNDIEDLPLLAVTGQDGAYYLMSGTKVLPDKQGKPVIVRVK